MKTIKIFSFLLASCLYSYGGEMDTYFDGQITTNLESAGAYEGQTRGLYTLGGFKARYRDTGSFNPVHITMPSLRYGCGGIDSMFGGFSYLNADYLIEKGKAIISNAPYFAFQIALSNLDKDTQSVVAEAQKIVQQLNNFDIDSCKASQRLADYSMNFFEDGVQQGLATGQSSDYDANKKETASQTTGRYINAVSGFFNGDSAEAEKAVKAKVMQGSLVKDSLSRVNVTTINKDMLGTIDGHSVIEGVIRYMVGDIVGYQETAEGKWDISYYPSGSTAQSIEKFINGGNISYTNVGLGNKNIGKPTYPMESFQSDGIIQVFRSQIASILTTMRANQELNESQRAFTQSVPIPLYKFLNTTVLSGDTNNDEILSEYLAIVESKAWFDWVMRGASDGIRMNIATTDDKNTYMYRKEIITNVIAIQKQLNTEYVNRMRDFKSKTDLISHYRSVQQQVEQSSETLW